MGLHFCFFFLLFFFSVVRTSSADIINGGSSNGSAVSSPSPSSSPFPPPPPPPLPNLVRTKFSPFRPSIAVIVGVLTTMFSITLLLLLYAKHCKRSAGLITVGYGGAHSLSSRSGGGGGLGYSSYGRKNSGIDRSVIESLPVFRFGSLMGQKDGLECAVCLTRFESSEVLRLLPKCKHAFHVECVDTWLDAHSTCPLCRYRVDPEDVLLLLDDPQTNKNQSSPAPEQPQPPPEEEAEPAENWGCRRVSGRHSSAGERGSGFLHVVVQRPGQTETSSFRRSVDGWNILQKKKNNKSETTSSGTVGCFDRPRKDGLLPTTEERRRRRVEHRIIVSPRCSGGVHHQRWSDVQPSDLLYLRSELIMSDNGSSRRLSTSSALTRQQNKTQRNNKKGGGGSSIEVDGNRWSGSGRTVINSRSVSEITGLSRFPNRPSSESNDCHLHHHHHQPPPSRQIPSDLITLISSSELQWKGGGKLSKLKESFVRSGSNFPRPLFQYVQILNAINE